MPERTEILDAGAARLLGIDVGVVRLTARGDLRPMPHRWPLRIRRRALQGFLTGQGLGAGQRGRRGRSGAQ